jgi:thiamine-phosphate pyrophosphorylase
MAGDKKYFRLFDANLNRCREGLRVIEDTARFVLGRDGAYKKARELRHEADVVSRKLYPRLLAERNSVSDAGRKLKEGKRAALKGVLAANFRRVEESLRVLEEYGKLVSATAGARFKKIRFQAYILEKELLG